MRIGDVSLAEWSLVWVCFVNGIIEFDVFILRLICSCKI